jgi:cytochrome b561
MGYGTVARQLHWIMAILILVMIPVGLIMTQEGLERATQDRLFILHKNVGSILLVLIVARFAWRLAMPPPPLPDSVPEVQRVVSKVVHWGLYATVFVMAASGYARVRMGGFPIEWLDAVGIPAFLPENEAAAERAKSIHATAKYVLVGLVALHVGAALYHAVVLRDGVFSRMWPPVRGKGEAGRTRTG